VIVCVVLAFYRLTVYADGVAWVGNAAVEWFAFSLVKAFTACTATLTGVLSSHHDVAFATCSVLIIGTV
jgi:hypothetical protein